MARVKPANANAAVTPADGRAGGEFAVPVTLSRRDASPEEHADALLRALGPGSEEARELFAEYQVVRLARDIPEEGLKAGARGAVLMVHPLRAESPREYEVEFVDEDGATLALLTLAEDHLEPEGAAG